MIKFQLNTKSFENRIKKIERNLEKEEKKYLRKTSRFLKDKFAKNTPRNTWKAKSSWTSKVNWNIAIIENQTNYIWYVNNWTKHIKARRFIEKTISRYEPVLKKQKQNFLKKILK